MEGGTIQVGNHQWFFNKVDKSIVEENLESHFFSWGEFSSPANYIKCDGYNIAMRKCTIVSQLFIECDFRGVDASDSKFIDCLFLNCLFEKANFHKASFIGTAIIQDTNCQNEKFSAGVSQTQFRSSQLNHSILSGLRLDGCSFRHSVFENAIFSQVSIEYTSFEDAYFSNCTIDFLDLRNSACRGIIINNCKIEKYVSSLEKTLGGIGILQTLEYCVDFELYMMNGNRIDESTELGKKLEEVSRNFLSEGKLFEFINIVNYLYIRKQQFANSDILPLKSALQLLIQNNSVNGYPISEKGKFLYQVIKPAYEKIINDGNRINLDDILYSLKLMFFLNINEYILLRLLLDIYKNEMLASQNNYSDFLALSQIKHYFQVIGYRIKSKVYRITFHNETASWLDKDNRNDFYDFCRQFVAATVEGSDDFKLISMHEGSIEAVFESFNINNILIIAAILGFRLKVEGGRITFVFNPAEGIKTYGEFIKQIASIIPLLSDKKVTKNKFEGIFKEAEKIVINLTKYVTKNKISGVVERNNASKEVEETFKETQKTIIQDIPVVQTLK